MKNKRLLIILVGPSGVGKSTFLTRVLKDWPHFCDIITYTSRQMRHGEKEGDPYHFVSQEQFLVLRDQQFFVEWAQVHGHFYGTPRDQIEKKWREGKNIIMDLDVQGARSIMKVYPHVQTLFIHPPSFDELRRRIVKREGREPKDLDLRLMNAKKELEASTEFKYQLVNRDFEICYGEIKNLIEEFIKSS